MNFGKKLIILAENLHLLAKINNYKITTAESCTGGLVSGLITSIAGSSEIFECGFVTYCNDAKVKLLNIDNQFLKEHGPYNQKTADDMAINSLEKSKANLSISITGEAQTNKINNSGMVFISSFNKKNNKLISKKFQFKGNREKIRELAIIEAMNLLILQINNAGNV
jgi:PncC family amidohydrolase